MDANPRGVYCLAGDTDRYHLQIARAHSKFLMEDSLCSDAGTRGDVQTGRRVGTQSGWKLRPVFEGAELVFVLAGMGGGTGGGAAPVISEVARKCGAIVVGLVTKPFQFERDKINMAIHSLRTMLTSCDTVILVDDPHPSSLLLPFGLNLDAAGQTCCSLISSIAEAFANPSLLYGDLGELRSMLRRGGLAKAGFSNSYSTYGAEEAALNSLRIVVQSGYLSNASGVFLNIVGNSLRDEDVASALDVVSRKLNPTASLLWARQFATNLEGTTKVSLLVTGISFPFAWGGYRRFPVEIFEMEPESMEEECIDLEFGLDQIENVQPI